MLTESGFNRECRRARGPVPCRVFEPLLGASLRDTAEPGPRIERREFREPLPADAELAASAPTGLTPRPEGILRPCSPLVQPGFTEFGEAGLGDLGFIVVTGTLDYRDADHEGRPGVEFSWQGSDEGDEVSGRGWTALNADGTLEGHVYFHLGGDSAFRAERFNGAVRTAAHPVA